MPALTYNLDQSVITLSPSELPPCAPSYLIHAPALNFSAPGTYPHQYLGQVTNAPLAGNSPVTVTGAITGAHPNLSVSNLQYSATPPSTGNINIANSQFLYGDITVLPGPLTSTSLVVAVNSEGIQIALGEDTINFSGSAPDTTGCSTNVTQSVQGSVGRASQLFGTQIWTQTVMIRNTSGAAINGPLELALTNLSPNARLFTASGTGTCPGINGAPYLFITDGLPANGNAAVVLTFTNSAVPSSAITYTPVVLAGGKRL